MRVRKLRLPVRHGSEEPQPHGIRVLDGVPLAWPPRERTRVARGDDDEPIENTVVCYDRIKYRRAAVN